MGAAGLGLPASAVAARGRARPRASGPVTVSVVQTSFPLGQRLQPLTPVQLSAAPVPAGMPVITVDDQTGYQRIRGFGAAMTDSSAWLIERELSSLNRDALMNEFFSPSGGDGLDFLRVPIGASDFTVGGRPYSYDDIPANRTDPHLRHFSVAHDRAYILPALLQARALNPGLELLASPWSPPAWMKANRSLGNVRDQGTLRGLAYGPWAAYIVKFLEAYAAAGAPIAALTPQNEPGNPTTYPGLNLSARAEAVWITRDLVPALTRAHLHPLIYGEDSGWSPASSAFAQATIASPAVPQLAGIAWHCYFGSPDVMSTLHAARPTLDTIVDECSPGISAIPISEVVISSLRNWASTVALWNLALDPRGGPVQPPNGGCPHCFGLATIDEAGGTIRLNLPYYQLGQASRFIEPGALRVASNTFVSYAYTRPGRDFITPGIDDVALLNPDGTRVLLAYNNGTAASSFAVSWQGLSFTYTLPAGATVTFRWAGPAS